MNLVQRGNDHVAKVDKIIETPKLEGTAGARGPLLSAECLASEGAHARASDPPTAGAAVATAATAMRAGHGRSPG